jgi:hypothetical protein
LFPALFHPLVIYRYVQAKHLLIFQIAALVCVAENPAARIVRNKKVVGLVNRHRTYIRRTDEAWNKNCIIAVVSRTVSAALFSYVTTFVSKFDTGGPDPFLVTNIIAPAISLIPVLV